MTVVTIILIGIVLAVGTIIINGLMEGTQQKACAEGGGTWSGNKCDYTTTSS